MCDFSCLYQLTGDWSGALVLLITDRLQHWRLQQKMFFCWVLLFVCFFASLAFTEQYTSSWSLTGNRQLLSFWSKKWLWGVMVVKKITLKRFWKDFCTIRHNGSASAIVQPKQEETFSLVTVPGLQWNNWNNSENFALQKEKNTTDKTSEEKLRSNKREQKAIHWRALVLCRYLSPPLICVPPYHLIKTTRCFALLLHSTEIRVSSSNWDY